MNIILTTQLKTWTSKFGQDYTDRSNQSISIINKNFQRTFGITITDLFKYMVGKFKLQTVLEVGCNTGKKLEILSQIGNYQLFGIDPQKYALMKARRRLPQMNFIEGTVFNLPFKDNYFDLVFTSEVLIHVAPEDLKLATQEIVRVTKKYILGFEYFSSHLEEIIYRGHDHLLWKRDFKKFYLDNFPKFNLVKFKRFEWNYQVYKKSRLFSEIFLLAK